MESRETFLFPIFNYKFELLQPSIAGYNLVWSSTSFQGILIGPNINGSGRVAYHIAETLTTFEYLYTLDPVQVIPQFDFSHGLLDPPCVMRPPLDESSRICGEHTTR